MATDLATHEFALLGDGGRWAVEGNDWRWRAVMSDPTGRDAETVADNLDRGLSLIETADAQDALFRRMP